MDVLILYFLQSLIVKAQGTDALVAYIERNRACGVVNFKTLCKVILSLGVKARVHYRFSGIDGKALNGFEVLSVYYGTVRNALLRCSSHEHVSGIVGLKQPDEVGPARLFYKRQASLEDAFYI